MIKNHHIDALSSATFRLPKKQWKILIQSPNRETASELEEHAREFKEITPNHKLIASEVWEKTESK